MDLAERELRMLEMQFFRAPAIHLLIQHQLNDFDGCASNARDAIFIDQNMFISSLSYSHTEPLITLLVAV